MKETADGFFIPHSEFRIPHFLSSLPLLMPRVGADHADHAPAADDLAVLTDASNAASHFHDSLS
jgi:hypothetical protein